ncbi:MAG: mucoidy inhibitor MuiA family protein [Planctomycetota bacterium]|nr:mucoidy inhibitor MuiA family protein [Planctomycetota bacterium]
MLEMLLPAALMAPMALPQEPRPVESTIVEVTVYGRAALVRRAATLPAGGGSFVLPGLPRSLDPDALRVSSEGAEVIGVELRERFQRDVPDERVRELCDRVRERERELQGLEDEAAVIARLEGHLDRLLSQDDGGAEGQTDAASPETWEQDFDWLQGKLAEMTTAQREIGWRIEAAQQTLKDARLELGRFESTAGVHLYDLYLDVHDTSGREAALEVDYVVGNAGWQPVYDLRAHKDLSQVEMLYRAKVWQRSGEDWRDVDVLLSTARPRRGAQGPEPRVSWLSLLDPRKRLADRKSARSRFEYATEKAGPAAFSNQELEAQFSVPLYSVVFSEGISVRFRLARKETIESRDPPTTVLVGRASLAIEPEHYCAPAVDTTVWLRGRTRNTSDWVMLPGLAAVYFGADFIGHAQVPAVQLGEELTLHLGPDQGLLVERKQLEDLREKPGFFSSRETLTQRWRIRVKNNGAFSSRPDGSVHVVVHEALPRAKDDRIKVEIYETTPDLAEGERWKKEREEKGLLTWVVRVPRGGERVIELATEITFPEDLKLVPGRQ